MSQNREILSSCCDNYYENLNYLKSIVKCTKDFCQEHEFSSVYYNLHGKYKYVLSEERNHYINMMSMALDRIENLKNLNDEMETIIVKLK